MEKTKLLGIIFILAYLIVTSGCDFADVIQTEEYDSPEIHSKKRTHGAGFFGAKIRALMQKLRETEKKIRAKHVKIIDPSKWQASRIMSNSFF